MPVERLPKGVDSERFTPEGSNVRDRLGLAGKRVVLTVARLVPIKNVQRLLDAMALGDRFLFDLAKKAVLSSLSDPEAIVYRQHVLADCLEQSAIVREI